MAPLKHGSAIPAVIQHRQDRPITSQLTMRVTVADFNAWKSAFDEHEGMRKDATLELMALLRGLGADKDDNDITLIFKVGDVYKAKAFLSSDDFKQRMMDSGATSAPNIYFGRQ